MEGGRLGDAETAAGGDARDQRAMTVAVVGVPRLAIATDLRRCGGMALTRNSEIDAVPNARSDAAGAGELAVRGNDARIEEIDVHTAAERAEVELGVQGMRRLAAGPLVDPVQGPTVGAIQLWIPALDRLRGDRIIAVGLRKAGGREATGQSARLSRSVLLNVRDSGQARQPLGLAPRGVDDEHAEMAEDGARVEPLSGGEVSRQSARKVDGPPFVHHALVGQAHRLLVENDEESGARLFGRPGCAAC